MKKEELEKEADKYFRGVCDDYDEELERTGKRHYWVGFDIKNGYIAGAESREKQITNLEKENAELKAEIENDRDLPAIAYMQGAEKQKKKDEEQLTKAKEIIRQFLNDYPVITKELLDKLEQFIKDSEVEK